MFLENSGIPDLVHENLSLRRFCHVYHLLDHVVGILVLHHQVQRTLRSSGGKRNKCQIIEFACLVQADPPAVHSFWLLAKDAQVEHLKKGIWMFGKLKNHNFFHLAQEHWEKKVMPDCELEDLANKKDKFFESAFIMRGAPTLWRGNEYTYSGNPNTVLIWYSNGKKCPNLEWLVFQTPLKIQT